MAMAFLVLIVFIVVVIAWVVSMYNKLVTGKNAFKNAFAQIDVQLKRLLRPHPEPGRDGQGLHETRAGDPAGR